MSQISLLSVSTVYPATPTPQPCWRALSTLDHTLSSHTYTKQVYYFTEISKANAYDFALLISQLKESLSQTLSHFYTLAGRVQHDETSGSLQINCNDAGVLLHVACAKSRLADWGDLQECSIEDELNPAELYVTDYSESPLIQVQVTKFLCGSIALGYVVSELVVDGYSAIEFVKSWSEMHRTCKISRLPLINAELLKPRNPPSVTIPIRDYVASKTPPHSASINFRMFKPALPAPYKSKLFTFTAEKIDALIEEIHNGADLQDCGFRATSFEAMAALIWKCMTEARELGDGETTIYLYPVSLRDNINRWAPRLPMNYFGNAVHIACLPAKAGDLKAKHVSYVARLLHEDIQKLSAEAMKSIIDWMQVQHDKGLEVGFNCDLYSGKVVHGTSMYIFPIYETDFGWGKPAHYSLVLHPWFGDGVAFMLPTPQGGRNRYLSVAMPEEQLNKLSTHPLFLAYATPTTVLCSAQPIGECVPQPA